MRLGTGSRCMETGKSVNTLIKRLQGKTILACICQRGGNRASVLSVFERMHFRNVTHATSRLGLGGVGWVG